MDGDKTQSLTVGQKLPSDLENGKHVITYEVTDGCSQKTSVSYATVFIIDAVKNGVLDIIAGPDVKYQTGSNGKWTGSITPYDSITGGVPGYVISVYVDGVKHSATDKITLSPGVHTIKWEVADRYIFFSFFFF